jgi:hypothetical protein
LAPNVLGQTFGCCCFDFFWDTDGPSKINYQLALKFCSSEPYKVMNILFTVTITFRLIRFVKQQSWILRWICILSYTQWLDIVKLHSRSQGTLIKESWEGVETTPGQEWVDLGLVPSLPTNYDSLNSHYFFFFFVVLEFELSPLSLLRQLLYHLSYLLSHYLLTDPSLFI